MSVPTIFDRKSYAARRLRQRPSFLAADVGENLAMRLSAINRRFGDALDLHSRDQVFAMIGRDAARWTRTTLHPAGPGDVAADEEMLPFAPACFDLVVSTLSLHAVNDLPGALTQIRKVMRPDGLFLAALFGGETLRELRTAFARGESEILSGVSPRVAPFADIRELGALLQRAGFALPVADSEKTVVRYGAFPTLVEDLRALGETNVLAGRAAGFLRRDVMASMLAAYADENPDGPFSATFEIIYLTAWAPHESQPKPLRPGSARVSLATAVGMPPGRADRRDNESPPGGGGGT